MDYGLKSVAEYPLGEVAAVFTQAFTGYIGGNVQLNATSLAAMIARDNVDLNASRVVVDASNDQPVGLGLIARQGWSSRVAAMGVIPEMQGKGAGRWLLENLQTEARARQERTMVLEVFEQNTPAVTLYTRMGFEIVRRLYGYSVEQIEPERADVQEIDALELGKRVVAEGVADLPWQVSGSAVLRMGFPLRAYQLDEAAAVVSVTVDAVVLRVLLVKSIARQQGQGAKLLRALAAEYPEQKWVVPQLCPEEFGGFFERMGFTRAVLNQVQMTCTL